MTANHQGYFEISLCSNNNPLIEADQECFDKYPLKVVDAEDNKYFVPLEAGKRGTFKYQVELPPYVTCTQCILQWTYYTGNTWGICANGTEAVGCGKPGT